MCTASVSQLHRSNMLQGIPYPLVRKGTSHHSTSACLQGYFYFWVILSFVWGLIAAAVATTLPIIESRFIIYSVAATFLPCFPFLKRWAAREDHGLATGPLDSSDSDDSSDFPKQDPKVKQFVQQSAVAAPEIPKGAQPNASDLHVIK